MSPRPRIQTDAEILAGTARVLARLGPAHFTLADVAAEVGLAPATLLQRFGSKRGLLLAFAERGVAALGEEFRSARAQNRSPLAALSAALAGLARGLDTPEALSNSLAVLQIDLRDPEFRRHALDHARAMRAEIQSLLAVAVAAGELVPCDRARLARAIQVTYNGSLLIWAIERDGPLADWLRDDLDQLLRPFRRTVAGSD